MAVRVCLFSLCGLCRLNEAEQKNRGAEKTVDMREAQRLNWRSDSGAATMMSPKGFRLHILMQAF